MCDTEFDPSGKSIFIAASGTWYFEVLFLYDFFIFLQG